MGYNQYTCSWQCSCRAYFCCFPLALANIRPWPLLPFCEIYLKKSELKTTHNTFPDCRVHFFRQPFSKQLYVYNQTKQANERTKLSVAIAKYGGSELVSGWNNIQLDHFNLGSWGVLYVKLFVFSILAIGIWHFYAIIMFWMVLAVRSIDVEWMLCRYFSSWQFCMAFSC